MKRFWLNLGQKLKNYAFERHRDVINDVIVCLIIVFVIHQKYRVVVLESCHPIGLYQDQILNNNLSVFTSKIFLRVWYPAKIILLIFFSKSTCGLSQTTQINTIMFKIIRRHFSKVDERQLTHNS